MGLRAKFNIVLVFACLIGMGLAMFLSYQVANRNALAAIEQETEVIRGNALAVRAYTSNNILPLLRDRQDILFAPPSVPSFSAQTVFAQFRKSYPEYYYKEAALNPTNPDDLAEPWEADLINKLRADDSLGHIAIERDTEEGRFYTVAYPLKITNEACLTCHSVPAAAPAAMVDLYGPENGFGWQMNEIIGAQIIYVPMEVAEQHTRDTVMALAVGLGVAFLLVLTVTNLLLGRIVVSPVRQMAEIAEKTSLGDFSIPEYERPGKDEIASLSRSFNRMRRSLDSAMKMLEE
ncbi:nitrate/nitrite sensor protein NarQ [Hartmannibacter diazotrophicus]|uniref:Nitrate/nitrite sensor protein NarQ n=1 Tax=Hartmannibacter diazotrophicus TaxID=1482074 RepID=A0A2C9D2D7_9HYPH|nr:DUF3365 domain-containing protein [Hartmannibacter diazotrophicus]SON54420.1 nitrate/nitrite sensor protein NarQ [Hartmannibacter diazotrophicus]